MFRWAALLGLAGLAAATAVIVWSGWGQVSQALAQAGILGIFAIALFHCLPLVVSAAGWRVLVPGKNRPSLPEFVYFMWIRAAVNNLMPVARVGGEFAAVRVMVAHGMKRNVAIASTVVELTLSIGAVFLFVLGGVMLFAFHVGGQDTVTRLIGGVALSLPLVVVMIVVQRLGFFGLLLRLFRLMFRDRWASLAGDAGRLDRAVTVLYRRTGRVLACGGLQFVAWSLGAVEIWIALLLLGYAVPLTEAIMIEALIQGTVSAAFAIPGALGVQEAGFLFFGAMLGLPPGTAAALAVMRRCRDLLCYAPGLIAWQAHEGKRLFRT